MLLALVIGRVLDLSGEERPSLAKLPEDVAAEGGMLLQPGEDVAVRRPVAATHERLEDRQILDRIEERIPFNELSLPPDQLVELLRRERAEPAPEDKMLRRRDRGDRVELEEAEPADGLEDAACAAVQPLSAHRDPPRLLDRDGDSA